MAERLAGGNAALALLANTIATGAALVALILTFGPISGAHLNPAVTIADALEGGIAVERSVPIYVRADCRRDGGSYHGASDVWPAADFNFASCSQRPCSSVQRICGDIRAAVRDLGLLRVRSNTVPFAVGGYIVAAYWFTASTSFANPAVAIARSLSNTFSGIRPADVPLFILAQFGGAISATLLFRWLMPGIRAQAKNVIVAHDSGSREFGD